MKEVVLFGNGQVASVAYAYLTHDSSYKVVAFTVDREYLNDATYCGLPVVPFEEVEKYFSPRQYAMFVTVSFQKVNKLRAKKYEEAKKKGYHLISYVHSKAQVWPDVKIGDNCFIMENNVLQPSVQIGNDVILWSGNHVGHHTIIKDHCFVASHVVISGNVIIEPYCFFGVNATIRDGIKIETECVIGAGALILKNTQKKEVYIGPKGQLLNKLSDSLEKI